MSDYRRQRTEVGGQRTEQGDGWMNRMIPAGLDGKNKEFGNLQFRTTFDIIAAAEKGCCPEKGKRLKMNIE